ncbi:MAG TPA: phosphotransferase [Polyangiaceae bacterium]|nr:phosphotransferase [Polyangiaceae bacterium]
MRATRESEGDEAIHAVRAALREYASPELHSSFIAEEMPGGASTRRFFRLSAPGHHNLVAMYVPLPSQEIAKARQVRGIEPFLEVQSLLSDAGVPVPRLHHGAAHHQVLLVEDLGDDTLAHYLTHSEQHRQNLYVRAVKDLARAQDLLGTLPADSIVRQRAFDSDLLRWEIEHFRDWALLARGVSLAEADLRVFDAAAEYLATTIAEWPRGFVHRDYQSRNLMVRAGDLPDHPELVWIDFQDAMLGPRVYDLVALLTDSYQTFSREFIEARLLDYCRALDREQEFERICYEFDVVTVQRKLKDAGRFVFLERMNDNPSFLAYVEPTIEKARRALRRVNEPGPLADLDALLTRLFGSI